MQNTSFPRMCSKLTIYGYAATLLLFIILYSPVAQADTIVTDENFLLKVRELPVDDGLTRQSQHALAAFYRDLSQLEKGERSQVTILQLGDSHTANDFFSGRLRLRMQEQFGNAGRGMMPPGVVYKGLAHPDIKPEQDSGWVIENSLKDPQKGPYGVSGFVARSTKTGAQMQLLAVGPQEGFDFVSVDYLTQPGGGKFQVYIDDTPVALLNTNGSAGHVKHFSFKTPQRAHSMMVTAMSRDIVLTGWGTTRHERGITLVSHGIVGTTAGVFKHWNPEIVQSDLDRLKPSLIIIAYGTNDGFETDFNQASFTQLYTNLLISLQQMAPNASILVIGPPDGEKVSDSCTTARTKISLCNFSHPPALSQVRVIERRVAEVIGADFWDWSALMPQGMESWVEAGLGRPDRVHFKIPGYEVSADQLFERLMTGYHAAPNDKSRSSNKKYSRP